MARTSQKAVKPGDRFGHLTVIADSGERKNGYMVWTCRCDCGNEINVDMRTLRRGTARDCGCMTKVGPRQKDITGERFGMLVAQYPTDKKGPDGDYVWHCICDCGGEVDTPLHQLRAGYRRSCGCLSHPPLKDFIGRRFDRLTVTAYEGKRDGIHRWRCRCDCGNEIVVGQTHLQTGKTRSCGCLKSEIMRENAKLIAGTSVTFLENNRAHLRVNNTSGHTGVYLQKTTGRWVARIGFRGKSYYLGTYDKLEDAVKARERGEEMHTDFLDWYYNEYLQETEDAREPDAVETAAEAGGSAAEKSAERLEKRKLAPVKKTGNPEAEDPVPEEINMNRKNPMLEDIDVNQKDPMLEDIVVNQKDPMVEDITVDQKSPAVAATDESQETRDSVSADMVGSMEEKDSVQTDIVVNRKDSVLEDIAVGQKDPMLEDIDVNQKSPVVAATDESQETKDFALEESTENMKTKNVILTERAANTSSNDSIPAGKTVNPGSKDSIPAGKAANPNNKDSVPAEDENVPAKKPVLLIKKTQGRKELA